ncbi:hypothetical protein COW36_18970 [bacterium (Candidatus Blackallbacteria) CG17_big_fil_post_rev_8_21_14_2_50_48_46]|uniref:SWIM-type domain-containing protein n=1 Tax=bacterium (Candidatus Blackallbacteria) CG17_big_fil_post_rev_8_21_14_2_50_48_46 TaxID=2014261 RepID=A0A2M7FZZ2_9BACT|nr:MAG: hypothetical protein COW64_25500 [bacterium (Candidatus Blackallbacteria) CG18_big_fil_WC_8_21_14_2_50_49_26]PIW15010.1 MAG: hypothetical protein COW36_18970 [bacterium (Candidatus Blackallbacteria) CG17_big_fil_post_rev_8_21_14_2_50_48_46]PIW50091.1 MAG: hypothetical protein COW20_03905 [bacterium (Candidatus Blackallbacteria) CG13_big_fil_rev_8_21_14_2_50_49_14]
MTLIDWNEDRVLALAPDAASVSAGKKLTQPMRWPLLGQNEDQLWGECQGSGSKPYRVMVDMGGPAYKCSCPSRKFPCKHSLALILLALQTPSVITEQDVPDWMQDWLNQRSSRNEAQARKKDEPPSEKSLQKREKTALQRRQRAEEGLNFLETWLLDQLRRGLASLRHEPYRYFDQIAARLVDAQMPGLARRVAKLAEFPASSPDWGENLLTEMGLLFLLIRGMRQENLPPALQAELETQIGWMQNQEELQSLPGRHDHWQVGGVSYFQEGAMKARRLWLFGENTGQSGYLLDFAHGTQPFKTAYFPTQTLIGETVPFPGLPPHRLLVKAGAEVKMQSALPKVNFQSLKELQIARQLQFQAQPWKPLGAGWLASARLRPDGEDWLLEDSQGHFLPLAKAFRGGWEALALGGGAFFPCCVEWEGQELRPLMYSTPDESASFPFERTRTS